MSLYLYAILNRRPARGGGRGLRREPVRFLRVAGLVVAAGAMPEAPPLSAAALRRHDATVRRLARAAEAILPVRFGTVVPDVRVLGRQLRPRARKLRAALALVAGREQMTLRVFGRQNGGRRASQPAPRRGDQAGRQYLVARLTAARRARAVLEIAPLRPALRRLIRAERVESHGEPPLLASLYHLVDRGQAPAYRTVVTRGARRLAGIRLRSSGPWAPYAFAPDGLG